MTRRKSSSSAVLSAPAPPQAAPTPCMITRYEWLDCRYRAAGRLTRPRLTPTRAGCFVQRLCWSTFKS